MADITTKGKEHPLTTVKMKTGEKVALCRCFASEKFPFCDGTHKQHPGKGPALVEAVAADAS